MSASVRPLGSAVGNQPQAGTRAELAAFPRLHSDGGAVRAGVCVQSGTGLWVTLGIPALVLAFLFSIAMSYGMALIFLPVGLLIGHLRSARVMARLQGSHLEVGARQFPEIHQCVQTYARRLGLREVPRVFIVEASEMNAFAFRLGSRKVVTLVDDVVWGALSVERPGALQFIIGHELAHHALGHTSLFRLALSRVVKPLSRLDELSADATALQLLGNREAATDGMLMLTIGPQLMPYVDRDALLRQASEVAENKLSKKAEAGLTHPLALRRLAALQAAEVHVPTGGKPQLAR